MYRGLFAVVLALVTTMFGAVAAEPQREIYNINEGWSFYFASAVDPSEAQYVSLPHTWDSDSHESAASYVRRLYVPEQWRGKRLFLRFGAVQSVADVFVNGYHVGEHKGGFTAFTMEITDRVTFGGDNTIRVVVSNGWRSDLLPLSTDLDLQGGIYRDVELMVTPRNIISPLHYATDGVFVVQESVSVERVRGVVKCYVSAPDMDHASLVVRITGPDGYLVERLTARSGKHASERSIDLPFEIESPQLWSPEHRAMYRVEVMLGSEEAYEDSVVVETGFRDISIDDNNRLCINGVPCEVRGATLAHDREGCGMAMSAEELDADLTMILDMGANAVRSLSGPHAEALYERCDREGVLCWIDMPFTRSMLSLTDICYYATDQFRESGKEQLREIIAQNFNHPSVVMWGLFSAVWQHGDDVVEYVRELYDVAHEGDASRLTVGCSNRDGEINFVTDVIVFYQDVGWYKGSNSDVAVWCRRLSANKQWAALRYGVCYGEEGIAEHVTDRLSRAQRGSRLLPERRQRYMHEDYAAIIDSMDSFWGGWLSTMFDYASPQRSLGINHSGVVEYDHTTPKDAYYLYRAMWNKDAATLYIADRNWRERRDTLQHIDIYSSVGTPTLTVNGESHRVRRVAPARYRADSVVIKGVARIEAYDSLRLNSDCVEIRCGGYAYSRDSIAVARRM